MSQICDALRDLVPFVQFKKRENTHGRVLLLLKLQAKRVPNGVKQYICEPSTISTWLKAIHLIQNSI